MYRYGRKTSGMYLSNEALMRTFAKTGSSNSTQTLGTPIRCQGAARAQSSPVGASVVGSRAALCPMPTAKALEPDRCVLLASPLLRA